MNEYYLPSWEEIHRDLIELAGRITASKVNYDIIVAIARGGWIIGRMLSDLLDNKNVANIRIEFYTNIGETMKKPVITQPISTPPEGKNILLCDDVADTGKSIKAAYDHLTEKNAGRITVVCLHKKPWSIYTPDYYIKETDKWIIYPWEYRETVKKLFENFKKEGLDETQALKKLREIAPSNTLFNATINLILQGRSVR